MAALAGQFVGAFAVALLFAVVWLIICMVIPPMRRRPGVSYGIAIALSFVPSLINVDGPTASNLLASLLCVPLLLWQMKRAQAKARAAAIATSTERALTP